jgi:hypothetical protein
MTPKGNMCLSFDQETGRWLAERSKYYLGSHQGMGASWKLSSTFYGRRGQAQ